MIRIWYGKEKQPMTRTSQLPCLRASDSGDPLREQLCCEGLDTRDFSEVVKDQPLANGRNEVLVRRKKKTGRTMIPVPEQFVMMIAKTDIEELYAYTTSR